ncbi:uncharacterized protein A4U43_C08F27530 [Asparagus officinalis]|nr:uncharacterized protein A4U43_C08F27530 [Asparagus officinalis]
MVKNDANIGYSSAINTEKYREATMISSLGILEVDGNRDQKNSNPDEEANSNREPTDSGEADPPMEPKADAAKSTQDPA